MKLLKKDTLSRRVEGLERIINFLRSRPDDEATNVLAKLRLGDRVEDVANSLPPTASSGALFKSPSLLAQESTDTSTSGVSYDSMSGHNESDASSFYRHGSTASITSSSEQRALSHVSSSKGKQPAIIGGEDEGSFLHIVFDRQDYLLPTSESDNEEDDDRDTDGNVDPRLLGQGGSFDIGTASPGSPMDFSGSGVPSPQKDETGRSIHATHLRSRQPIVNTIRLHPNLNLRDLFGNMPFSSSIRANHFDPSVQDAQANNLSLPTWSMMTINTKPDPGSLRYAFPGILKEATTMIYNGTPVELVIETHPNIAALFNKDEFERSGILSQWAASMVHSTQLKGNDFTCFASMYLFWYLMRWMISPSPETYETIPEWLRPTPNQLFMPHISMLDFIAWPAFRELAVQLPAMQQCMVWLMDMSINIRCDWWSKTEDALMRDAQTGFVDLCPAAKETMRNLSNWSVGPSFRGYVRNADSYVRIRTEEL